MIARSAVVLLASGCLKAIAPDVGPLEATTDANASGCSNADSNPAATVSFRTDLLTGVFRRYGCANCHTGDGIGISQSGLDLSSYTTLRNGGSRSQQGIVVNFMPCQSVIVQKVGVSPPYGRQMPYNGPPYLSTADIQLIADWIAEGASDN